MKHTHLIGVDPGLVHTGVVSMLFLPDQKRIVNLDGVIDGLDEHKVKAWVDKVHPTMPKQGFIEGYRPRNNLSSDRRMQAGVSRMREATGFKVLDNTGVKSVITPGMMQALGVWLFDQPTHHQDLRSAARIALLGFIKTDDGNRLVADIIRDHLNGDPWTVS